MANLADRVNVGVGVVVINENDEVLLGKRISDKHGKGQYSFPGGKPDPGESPVEAAARELHEETGLAVDPDDLDVIPVWTYDRFEDDSIHFVTLYFSAWLDGAQPVNTEPDKCEAWEWFHPENLPEPLFCGVDEALGQI